MDTLQLSDYAERYVVDRFSSLDGVAQVRIGGRQRYAMRIWLDRDQLAARALTVADVEAALQNENVELPAGSIESAQRDFTLRVERSYLKPEDFARLPLSKGEGGYVVRLGDVARVEAHLGRAARVFPEQWRAQRRPGHRAQFHRSINGSTGACRQCPERTAARWNAMCNAPGSLRC